MMGARMGSGLWDVLTFPVKVPKDYGSLIKPDSVFENWPQRQEGIAYKNLWDR
jgi:hypothetical protein